MKQFNAAILQNRNVARDLYELQIPWQGDDPRSGQFLTLRFPDKTEPLLRRPFAFSGFDPRNRTAEIIYQIRGRATETLARAAEDDLLDVIGPLGNFFPEPAGDEVLLVAGGIGLGPILFLHSRFEAEGIGHKLIIGARTADLIPEGLPTAILCTDDGSRGVRGTVVDVLAALPSKGSGCIYTCGPEPMMRAVSQWGHDNNRRCWVSMEQTMACGVGACMGCVIQVVNERYARVCSEGPVFDGGTIVWN